MCYFYIRCNVSKNIVHNSRVNSLGGNINKWKLTKRGESWRKVLIESITETCGDVIECYEESQMQFLIDNSSKQKLPHNWKNLLKRPSAGIAEVIMGQDWCGLDRILDEFYFVPVLTYRCFSYENVSPVNHSITSVYNFSCFYLPCYTILSMRRFSI